VRKFGAAIWEVLAISAVRDRVRASGRIHYSTSIFVCDTGGMVCLRRHTGYNATVDLRYLWMRQKRCKARTSPMTNSHRR